MDKRCIFDDSSWLYSRRPVVFIARTQPRPRIRNSRSWTVEYFTSLHACCHADMDRGLHNCGDKPRSGRQPRYGRMKKGFLSLSLLVGFTEMFHCIIRDLVKNNYVNTSASHRWTFRRLCCTEQVIFAESVHQCVWVLFATAVRSSYLFNSGALWQPVFAC